MTKDIGYIVPDPIDPEDTVCIRVYVPAHQLYVAAFMRAYQYFGQWVAWERDQTGKAAQAAAVWRDAIERTMTEFDCSQGECGIMDIRQPEGVPCIIEKQAGCDGAWEQAVDLRLCVPRMRIMGGVLQQDVTGNGDWQNAGDPEDPYDPRTDAPAPAPWTDPPAGESGECLSAANVASYVDFVAYSFASSMVDGLTFFQTLSAAMAILTALIDLIPLTALTALITALYETVVDAWEDVRDFSIISKLTELMVCKYNADGSMTEAQFNALIDECNTWRNGLTDTDQRAKWAIAIATMQLWGPVGMTISGKIWGITTYECTYNECQWSHTFDFTISDGGWGTDGITNNDGGDYQSDGWHHYDKYEGTDYYRMLGIGRFFDEANLTKVIVRFAFTEGSYLNFTNAFYVASPLNNFLLVLPPEALDNGSNVITYTFPSPTACDMVRLIIRSSQDNVPAYSGSILLTSVTIEGTGIDPFI